MRQVLFAFSILIAAQANCQLSEVTYDVETNDTIDTKSYPTDWARWAITDEMISWKWYDKDSNLLISNQYSIVSKETTEMGFDYLYLVEDDRGSSFIIQLWVYADRKKSVSHRYGDGVVHYTGNVSF